MDMNFASWVLSPVEYDENQPLLIDASKPERSLTFKQLKHQVHQLIAGLRALGIQHGDCVCVNAFNDISYSVLYLGIIGAGAVFTGVNPAYSEHELAHHISMVTAKVVIVEPSMLEKTVAAAESCGVSQSDIFVFDIHEPKFQRAGIQSWSTLLERGEGDFDSCTDSDKTVAAYQTSSGTSGLPKAAMIPHSYLIHQASQRISEHDIGYEIRRLTALPPMHAFATPIIPSSIRQGSPTYVMRRYDQSEFIKAVTTYQITETWLPPPPLIAIPKCHLATKAALQSIRQVWFGGAALSYDNQLPLQNLLRADAKINPVWGMTEVGWITTVPWPKRRAGDSIGSPLMNFTVRVVDDDGNALKEQGSTGELQILAPHPMLGYLGNPEANNETITFDSQGRWINSGDIGYIDSEGNIFIVDRKKDLIKVRGWQVSPNEVESRIQQHPQVLDVGVVGVPLPSGEGEIVRAYVVRHCDSHMTKEDIKRFAGVELARYKIPEEIVFIDSIPRNPTGKILRRLLREQPSGDVENSKIRGVTLRWLWQRARHWAMAIRRRISWFHLVRAKGRWFSSGAHRHTSSSSVARKS
ncbi:amp dependent CoA ligase [Lophiotrema nucula]|uniref:Amp dependent CoA ligase n=1 Tax=Lophiotrema nucula TaxID=690887 RepID=A0A6A5ZK54_9PLEO|nr:amp dependent CoA ligase [Lophiotrema nucula]